MFVSLIIRLTNKPKKKQKKSEHSHKRRESDDTHAEAVAKNCTSVEFVSSQDSELLGAQRGTGQARRNWMQKVLGKNSKNTNHTVLCYVKPSVWGKRKGPSFGKNTSKKFSHQPSPCAMEI